MPAEDAEGEGRAEGEAEGQESMTRHTVATLVAAVSPEDLAAGICRLYWADQDKDLDAYLEMQTQLRAMKSAPTTMSCVLSREWSDDNPPEPIIDVHGYEMGDEQAYAIGFEPWPVWLGMEVKAAPELDLSDADMLANILYEMSFYGFDPDEVSETKDEMIMRRKDEVDQMIEDGRVDELPTIDDLRRNRPG